MPGSPLRRHGTQRDFDSPNPDQGDWPRSQTARSWNSSGTAAVPPPSGRVAIVYAEVQDYAQLWEADQEAMSASLRLYQQEMRAGVRKYSGYEAKAEGDALMVVFSTSRDAVRWCLYMQEQLLGVAWPERFLLAHPSTRPERDRYGAVIWRGMRVRMGVHAGQPEAGRDGVTGRMNYVGPAVNLASRCCGAAQGGQVVLSKDAFDDVRSDLRALGLPTIEDKGIRTLSGLLPSARLYAMIPAKLNQRQFSAQGELQDQQGAATLNESMTAAVRELNSKLADLDSDGDAVQQRQGSVVLSDMSWLGPPLQRGDTGGRLAAARDALQRLCPSGQGYSEAQDCLDKLDFGAGADRVISAATEAMNSVIVNVYDLVTNMVWGLPDRHKADLAEAYGSAMRELRTALSSTDAVQERLAEMVEQRDALQDQVTRAEAQLVALQQELSQVRRGQEPAGAARGGEDAVSVVLLQVESCEAMHRSCPGPYGEAMVMLRCLVEQLMQRHGGERTNYGEQHLSPSADHGPTADFWTQQQRPAWCADAEYMLVFPGCKDAVWFCAELQRQLLKADWPEGLGSDCIQLCTASGSLLWRGVRVRTGVASGVVPPPRLSPKGVRWYGAPVCFRAARMLAVARGGEIVVANQVWDEYKRTSSGPEDTRLAGDGIVCFDCPEGDGARRVFARAHVARESSAEGGLRPRRSAGRFLDTEWWVPGAASDELPGTEAHAADMATELLVRDVREAQLREAVARILRDTRLPDGRDDAIAEAHAMLEAHERRHMAACDDPGLCGVSSPLSSGPAAPRRRTIALRRHRTAMAALRRLANDSHAGSPRARDASVGPRNLAWVHEAVRDFVRGCVQHLGDPPSMTAEQLQLQMVSRVLGPGRPLHDIVTVAALAVDDGTGADDGRVADSCCGYLAQLLLQIRRPERGAAAKGRKASLSAVAGASGSLAKLQKRGSLRSKDDTKGEKDKGPATQVKPFSIEERQRKLKEEWAQTRGGGTPSAGDPLNSTGNSTRSLPPLSSAPKRPATAVSRSSSSQLGRRQSTKLGRASAEAHPRDLSPGGRRPSGSPDGASTVTGSPSSAHMPVASLDFVTRAGSTSPSSPQSAAAGSPTSFLRRRQHSPGSSPPSASLQPAAE
eukprot:TRINITY_DN352_c1_g1_i1.p1 TRINITY_DN352_c1_g1~~TRINITY_DN352_c1_g1_i1.p1  ORF type:complete len:1130 (+),score=234.11 TRINITY_DN352_c1_g1_i1:71-3460(+)